MQRLDVSCAVQPIYGSLGAKGLIWPSLYLSQKIVSTPPAFQDVEQTSSQCCKIP
jgi:hypothetical protein